MGTLLDLASLVVVPSGYKEDVVYSVKPTDGSGDLDFTRSNDTATRVNSAGLIEKVRTNLYPRGSALLATGWTAVGATLTAGQTDPNGGTTALRVELAAGSSPYSYIYETLTGSAATYTRSVFIKGATAQTIRVVDPFTGVGSTINLTTSYQRFTAVAAGIAPSYGIQFDNNIDNGARDFTIAFVQIEEGDIATDYIPTTTTAVSVGMTANVPRLDYSGGGCPKLLLEPQRSNFALYSEQFNNAAWSLGGLTITANNITSPDGYTSADKLTEDTSPINHLFYNTNAMTASATSTFSIFYKKGTRRYFAIKLQIGSNSYTQVFDADSVATTSSSSNGLTGVSTSILSYGNGWVRASVSGTDPSASTACYGIVSLSDSATPTFDPSNYNPVYQGSVSENGQFWGAQLEAGSYATSYIPTLGAAVTRGADTASKTGISSLIGQTEYTIYWEGSHIPTGQFNSFATFFNVANTNNSARFYRNNTNNEVRAALFSVSSGLSLDLSSSITSEFVKCAIRVKAGSYAFYVNGTLVNLSTSALAPPSNLDGVSLQYFNSTQSFDQNTSQLLFFPSALTNTQLAELTTL